MKKEERKHKMIFGWIVFLLFVNIFYLFLKTFMRSISVLLGEDNLDGDTDIYDTVHKYRFLFFSTADILNGLSVLYCFHSMASLAQK